VTTDHNALLDLSANDNHMIEYRCILYGLLANCILYI
jgi:hypothetical protein